MLEPGAIFHDRYRVVRCIKSGGMGTVYEACDTVTDRARALKTMLPSIVEDAELRARFASEATVTAKIRSQHIVEVFDAGIDRASGIPFLVMELLEGEDLGARLQREGPLPWVTVSTLLRQLARALDRTHDAGIVHRDLKPENLFVTTTDEGTPHLMVLDFGIAKVVAQSAKAKTTRNVGTPLYMSPEQVRGDGRIDRRADLYAVGHIAFALLTGHAYFETEAESVSSPYGLLLSIAAGATETARIRAAHFGVSLPEAFDAWFSMATAIDRTRRFETACDMVTALSALLEGVSADRPAPAPYLGSSGSSSPVYPNAPPGFAVRGPGGEPPLPNTDRVIATPIAEGALALPRTERALAGPPARHDAWGSKDDARASNPATEEATLHSEAPQVPRSSFSATSMVAVVPSRPRRALFWGTAAILVGLLPILWVGAAWWKHATRTTSTGTELRAAAGTETPSPAIRVIPSAGTPTTPSAGTPTTPSAGTPTTPSAGTPTTPSAGTPTTPSAGTPTTPSAEVAPKLPPRSSPATSVSSSSRRRTPPVAKAAAQVESLDPTDYR
jgi:serine/threonine protein kinase